MSGGPRPGHAPTNGLAKEIWDLSEEDVAAIFDEDEREGGE